MKYAIIVTGALLIGVLFGWLGMSWAVKTTFHDITNVTWTQLVDGSAACEQAAQEKCAMYGGFAPRSQFSDK